MHSMSRLCAAVTDHKRWTCLVDIIDTSGHSFTAEYLVDVVKRVTWSDP